MTLIVDPATRDFVELTGPGRARLGHLPGLDGLRGVAVLVVLAFHAGFEKMVGGYLGVSTFFTLSGFLITSLLLSEVRATGTVAIRSFWSRRFRRLLPAAVVTLFLVMTLFALVFATADQRSTLPGDVLASLFDVANWHFILSGSSYGDLFTAPSPVLHFWSLAIEEQFYVIFPLLVLGLWWLCRGSRRALGICFGVLAGLSFLEPFVFSMSHDRIYFGTDTRASELLLGGVLAVVLSSGSVRRRLAMRLRPRQWLIGVATVALAAQMWCWWAVPQSSDWLYRGGFTAYAVLSCIVIAAVALPSGPLRSLMTLPVLRWFGARSYGIYLIHWPVLLAVRQTFPDWPKVLTTAVWVSISVGLAVLSYHRLERPIRSGTFPPRGRVAPIALGAVSLVALLALFMPLPVDKRDLTADFDSAAQGYDSLARHHPSPTTTAPPLAVPTPGVAFYGDSTALLAAMGFTTWGDQTGKVGFVSGDPEVGCGISRFVSIRLDVPSTPPQKCRDWPTRWAQLLPANRPDVAILMSSVWELGDSLMPGSKTYQAIGTPAVDDFIRSEFLQAVDLLASSGALVIIPTAPVPGDWGTAGLSPARMRMRLPERTHRLNQIFQEVAAARPDTVRIIDFATWFQPKASDPKMRSDGIHIQPDQFQQLTEEWFGQAVLDTWADWWRTHRAPTTTTVPPSSKKSAGSSKRAPAGGG